MGEKKRLWITRRLSDKTLERAQQYYDCEINFEDRVYSQDELIGRSAQFDAILPCHSEIFHGDVVEKLDPRVRIIANHSVGTDHCDIAGLKARGITVTNIFDYDAVLAPSATGEAPLISEGHTGNAINCLTWTLAGLPCLSLPAMVGDHDLPIGLQLIAGKRHDDRLFSTSSWLTKYLQGKISENGGA